MLKDLNLMENGLRLNIPPILKQSIMSSLDSDSKFLMKYRLIDYSLLLFIVDLRNQVEQQNQMMTLVFNRVNSMYEEAKLDRSHMLALKKMGKKAVT